MNLADILLLKFPEYSTPFDWQVSLDEDRKLQITYWNVPDVPQPTQEQIDSWLANAPLNLEHRVNVVREQRMLAYPSPMEQLLMQYNDKMNNTTTWVDAIKAVNDKFPIPQR